MPRYQHVGITGANGQVGRVLVEGLADGYTVRAFTRREVDFESTVMQLGRAEEIAGAFEGLDAVIHLAADPSPGADWESIRENNFEMTYQVFEACRTAGVKRMVFASTNHTQHGNTILTTPETLDTNKKIWMKWSDLPNPDSLYAVSKLFGENLGKYYSEHYGLEFVGMRIGWLTGDDDPSWTKGTKAEDYMRAMYLSHQDCVVAHRRALEVETQYLLAYVVSNNDRRVFDLEETVATLGFEPQDNAEDYF